ncbi:haloacid dehalogenase-like hydrolase superfamily hydrolase [Klebsormidium nitens]|uniref:Haloacid dehalogenase-like hydrolase superfamily hydrolase n=1 Tax=Klebsormidium nitens TaxID=105231 RepID=A0A0U9HLT3_KLENI|nr:haloacid dehalogenase-like hydrolase superfamily hydrolase [Klebsormidium nitens]|eukprot:GAQ77600.1 haloacid dehalogenase-like hydrolase superfamily hydrolase [Klebsormidium nitens]
MEQPGGLGPGINSRDRTGGLVGDEAAHPLHPGRERFEHAASEEVSELSDRVALEDLILHDVEAAEASGENSSASSHSQKGEQLEAGAKSGPAWGGGYSQGRQSTGAVLEGLRQLRDAFEAAQAVQGLPLSSTPLMNPSAIYPNRSLRLDQISVYGFDYDYTIAHYTEHLQPLIYNLAVHHLVKEFRYPRDILSFRYDEKFPIRGLYYDKRRGYLLKLDFFHAVEPGAAYFGRRALSRQEIEEAYGRQAIPSDYMHNLVSLMDLFCLSEACLISDVIQHFVSSRIEFDPMYVYEDVKKSIDYVHRSALMHRAILEKPSQFLLKQPGVIQQLKRLKASGKKLFILTNSPFFFVDGGMRYLFQDDGQDGQSWRQLFDVVIALADKPNWYTSERPFRFYNDKKDSLTWRTVRDFKPGSVYYHGCLKDFLTISGWKGSDVLYFGDHLYSDLRGPTRAGWRTAAIIRELEHDIDTQNRPQYRFQQAKYHALQELLGRFHGFPATGRTPADAEFLKQLQLARREAKAAMKTMFSAYFGSAFLTHAAKESAFAYNVQRYADVYTSKLENFLQYPLDSWLFAPHDVKILPHHIKIEPSSLLPEQ